MVCMRDLFCCSMRMGETRLGMDVDRGCHGPR